MRLSSTPDSAAPAGFHFTGNQEVSGVSHTNAIRILEQAGIVLNPGDSIVLPPETLQLLQKKTERTEKPTKTKISA